MLSRGDSTTSNREFCDRISTGIRATGFGALVPMLTVLFLVSSPADAQNAPGTRADTTAGSDASRGVPRPETESETSWYALPAVYYTPETSLGLGAAGGVFLTSDKTWPSSIQGDLSATLRGQYAVNVRPELYRRGGRQRLFADLSVTAFPDSFYGIGPDTPESAEEDVTTRFFDAQVQLERPLTPGWRVGVRIRVRHETVTEIEGDGLLASGRVPGADGSTVLGIGPLVTRDTRDRPFYPRRGTFAFAYAVVHPGWMGSTSDFSRVVVDARHYLSVGKDQAIALQIYGEAVAGTAPFTILPRLGGPLRLRGYLNGRFRDDVYGTAQGEWRFPVRGRFRGALFAATGAVAPRWSTFGAEGLEVAGGLGVRYRVSEEGVHIRLDYAVGLNGGGLYITAQDPF